MSALKLTSQSFATTINTESLPVLVDCWAPWCGPCKMLGPIVDELAGELAGSAIIAKLDIDDAQDIAAEYGVSAIPTLLIFKDGVLIKTMKGLQSKSAMKAALGL